MAPLFNSQFVQVALPIVITLIVAILHQNKRFDDLRGDMNRQFGEINRQLEEIRKELKEIRTVLTTHGERIARLEERISPIHHN